MAIKETLARELKLRAGKTFRLPELGGEAIEPRLFVSTYHDTVDHRLARRGQRVTRSFDELEVELLDGESKPKVFQALDLDFHPEAPAGRMPDTVLAARRLIEREHARARLMRERWRAAWKQLAKTA